MPLDPTTTDYRNALNFRLAAQNPRPALPIIQIPVAEGDLTNPFDMGDKKLTQFHVKGTDLYYSLDGEDKVIYVADLGSRHKVKRTINLKSMPYNIYENQWGILGDKIYGLAKTEHSNVADAWWTYGINSNILRTFLFPATYNVWNDIEPVENFGTMDKALIFDYDNDRILLACYNVGRNTFSGTFTMPSGEFISVQGGSFDGSGEEYPFGPLYDFDTSYFGPATEEEYEAEHGDSEDGDNWVDVVAEASRASVLQTFSPSLSSEGREFGAVIVILNDNNTVEHLTKEGKPVMWFFRSDTSADDVPHVLSPIHMDEELNSSQRLIVSKSFVKDEFLYANCRVFGHPSLTNTNFQLRYLGAVVWHFKMSGFTHAYLTDLGDRYIWDYTEDADDRNASGVEPILEINGETEIYRISPATSFLQLRRTAWNNNSNLISVIEDEDIQSNDPLLNIGISKTAASGFDRQDWIDDVLSYCNIVIDEDSDIAWFSFLDRPFDPSSIDDSQPTGHTSLVRYTVDDDLLEFAQIVDLDWQNPVGGYSFDVVVSEDLPTTSVVMGTTTCRSGVNVNGFYTISDFGQRYASEGSIAPFRIEARSGVIYATPEIAAYMTPGIDYITVRYRLDTGQFSDIPVRLVFYDHEETETKKPKWNDSPYDFTLSRNVSGRTLVGNVSALGADSYTTRVGSDWDLEAITGDLYWSGTGSIPEDKNVYNFVVEAVNTYNAGFGLTGQLSDSATQTVVIVDVED